MKRLDRIREALQVLNPGVPETISDVPHPHISRTALIELMDCLQYVCFPECTTPPPRIIPPYIEHSALMEWVLSHVADILCSQIYFAFLLHGDPSAVEDLKTFHPVQNSQRTPLDWNGPSTGTLQVSSLFPLSSANGDGAGESNGAQPQLSGSFNNRCKAKAEAITSKFLIERLPHVRWLLHTDVEALFRNDVAATSPSEVVLCYPGIRCMMHQRVAHQLYLLGAPTNFTRMLTEIAHSMTGIDIHPITSIGHHFFIDHGTGIVVGATAIIGNYVSLYQGVTLGAKSFPTDKKTGEKIRNLPRHPILEDYVTVYANAVVLGRVTIGEGSTIGGNCWVVRSVPPFSSIVQTANRVLAPHEKMILESDGSSI